ncbi:rho GTPase-activating protein 27-like [Hypomesus transpacificus]|uniref:rho GTPase-activating protein 27-like n=1 Tax=Hypomesus transpacificus TaxID=137520 RepID=UPI001F08772B|nr:rho GTPase-activating protein 27-like [Hypomesus transpacificus]
MFGVLEGTMSDLILRAFCGFRLKLRSIVHMRQVENADPNTAVYANITDLKKSLPQPPLVLPATPIPIPGSAPSSCLSSPGAASPASSQEGWQVHTDQDSGKEFYHHPATGKTSWASPLSPPALSSSVEMDLPRDREVLLGPSPALSPAPSSASSQSSGWEQLLDETSGRHYYYNPTSGATSWGVPEPTTPSSPGSEAAAEDRKPCEGPPPLPEEDYPTEVTGGPVKPPSVHPRDPAPVPGSRPVIPRASLDVSAPTGWTRTIEQDGRTLFTCERTQEQWIRSEDEKGKTYYYLRGGSRSQWNLPEETQPPVRGAPVPTQCLAAPSQLRLGNGLEPDVPLLHKNWRHTILVGPTQFGPPYEDTKFFPTHKRNASDFSDASSASSPENPAAAHPLKPRRRLSSRASAPHLHSHLLEKAGILNKTKVADHGKRLRKNWGQSWTVLHGGILTFHRDPKSAPTSNSNKSNQIVPEHTVELRGAGLAWASKDKSSKKHVVELKTRHGCEYLVQYDTESIIWDWFKVIQESIRQLRTIPEAADHKPQKKEQDLLSEEEEPEPTEKSPQPADRDEKDRKRTSTKVGSGSPADSEQGRVRTKLRKFLQRRPTLQSVKEKGYIIDSVFGCHLDTLCHRENTTVPKFVEKCIKAVERRGLDIDGIYRVSGNLAVIQRLRHKADHEEDLDLEDGQWEEIHVIAGALKLFLREMPEPLFPYNFFDRFIAAIKISDYKQKVSYMKDLVRSLPLPNHDTMEHLFKHLRKVAEYGEVNRMSVQSLAIVFGPTLLRPQTESGNITIHMVFQNQIVELILNEYEVVFAPS